MQVNTQPVEDTVPKINNEVAVGEDLRFQERWWRFEKIIWPCFAFIILLDILGVFGKGPLADAEAHATDRSFEVKYERIERYGTPSILNISFDPKAVQDNKIEFWVSDTLVKNLGNQRIVPQPLKSQLSGQGITYTFPATPDQTSVSFALQPATVGVHPLRLSLADGHPTLTLNIYVVP
jgi:hypothetical protein